MGECVCVCVYKDTSSALRSTLTSSDSIPIFRARGGDTFYKGISGIFLLHYSSFGLVRDCLVLFTFYILLHFTKDFFHYEHYRSSKATYKPQQEMAHLSPAIDAQNLSLPPDPVVVVCFSILDISRALLT